MHTTDFIGVITVLTTAVVFGTDFFFAFIGKKALLESDEASMVNVIGNMHAIADKRMPLIGATAIIGTACLLIINSPGRPDFTIALVTLLVHLLLYLRIAKPVNEQMKEAVKYGRILTNARALQKKWDSVIGFRTIALLIAMVFILLGLSGRP